MESEFFEEQREQSQIKAEIVTAYFWKWANLMVQVQNKNPRQPARLAYVDLFAGPGRYRDGAASTPVMVLERAVKDAVICNRLEAIFNDVDRNNTDSLRNEINAIEGIGSLAIKPRITTGEIGKDTIEGFKAAKNVPTFLFVDPFGYKGLSLELVNSVLKDWGCDCVFFFNYNRISMGIVNPCVEEHMNCLFGVERANNLRLKLKLQDVRPAARESFIVEEMQNALKEMGGEYVIPFRFRNAAGTRTTHHLFFVSKNFKGYEIMRDVMWKHSHKDGSLARFEYNPATADCPNLFEFCRPLGDLEDMLLADFAGRTLNVREIFETHSVGKPFVIQNYREVLCRMEQEKKVTMNEPCPPRRKGSLAERIQVTFPTR